MNNDISGHNKIRWNINNDLSGKQQRVAKLKRWDFTEQFTMHF